jgi:hypothetical protein
MTPAASRVEATPAAVFMWVMLCPGLPESATAAFGSATRIKDDTAIAIVLRSFITLLRNLLIR